MKNRKLLVLVVMVAMAVAMFGCAKDKDMSEAVEKAQSKLLALKKSENGAEASKQMKDIIAANPAPKKLSQEKWLIKVAAIEQQELRGYVQAAYAREAHSLARLLIKTESDPKMAMDYREKFLQVYKKSGRRMESFGMTQAKLDQIVVKNLNDIGINTPVKVVHVKPKTKSAPAAKKKQRKVQVAKARQ